MAFELAGCSKRKSTTSVCGNHPYLLRDFVTATLRNIMNLVMLETAAELADSFPHSPLSSRTPPKRDFCVQARQKNQPTTTLWNTIILGVLNVHVHHISDALKRFFQFSESDIVSQARYILHHHGFRPKAFHETKEIKDEIILRIDHPASAVQPTHCAKPLARRAASEQIQFTAFESKLSQNFWSSDPANVFPPQMNIRMIRSIRLDG